MLAESTAFEKQQRYLLPSHLFEQMNGMSVQQVHNRLLYGTTSVVLSHASFWVFLQRPQDDVFSKMPSRYPHPQCTRDLPQVSTSASIYWNGKSGLKREIICGSIFMRHVNLVHTLQTWAEPRPQWAATWECRGFRGKRIVLKYHCWIRLTSCGQFNEEPQVIFLPVVGTCSSSGILSQIENVSLKWVCVCRVMWSVTWGPLCSHIWSIMQPKKSKVMCKREVSADNETSKIRNKICILQILLYSTNSATPTTIPVADLRISNFRSESPQWEIRGAKSKTPQRHLVPLC